MEQADLTVAQKKKVRSFLEWHRARFRPGCTYVASGDSVRAIKRRYRKILKRARSRISGEEFSPYASIYYAYELWRYTKYGSLIRDVGKGVPLEDRKQWSKALPPERKF